MQVGEAAAGVRRDAPAAGPARPAPRLLLAPLGAAGPDAGNGNQGEPPPPAAEPAPMPPADAEPLMPSPPRPSCAQGAGEEPRAEQHPATENPRSQPDVSADATYDAPVAEAFHRMMRPRGRSASWRSPSRRPPAPSAARKTLMATSCPPSPERRPR